MDFSDPDDRPVGRFRGAPPIRATAFPSLLDGKKIAVVSGTALMKDARSLFTQADVRRYPTIEAAREALSHGEADLLFGDGFSLAFWL